MSFSAKADMELIWEQDLLTSPNKTKVQAYCVFAEDGWNQGTVYIYTYSVRAREMTLISVYPHRTSTSNTGCKRNNLDNK